MLNTRENILWTAKVLARHLDRSYRDEPGKAWTDHIFQTLGEFCQTEFGINPSQACFHRRQREGKEEFLWDFLALGPANNILLAAESEQQSKTQQHIQSLRHDFEKLFYVYAPIKLLVCKCESQNDAVALVNQLETYMPVVNFNPGSVVLLHFRLWYNDKETVNFFWQSSGSFVKHTPEMLKFERLSLR